MSRLKLLSKDPIKYRADLVLMATPNPYGERLSL
jgi:hypothetical protein